MEAAGQPVVRLTPQRRLAAVAPVLVVWVALALPMLLPSWRCPSAAFHHRPCPGCGMTRAMVLLFEGHFGASFSMHPLAVPTTLAYCAMAVVSVVAAWRVGSPFAMFEDRWGRRALFFLMGVMLLVFVLWMARAGGAFGGPVPV